MWVSRTEWESLKRRLDRLEQNRASTDEVTFRLYDPEALKNYNIYGYGNEMPSQTLTIKQAVSKIMDNLGMRMTYVKGTPTTISIDAPTAALDAKGENK